MKQAIFYGGMSWKSNYPDPLQELAEIAKKSKIESTLDAYTRINRRQGITSREELE
jgi:hypothetical protein